jgi:hypothetical protein
MLRQCIAIAPQHLRFRSLHSGNSNLHKKVELAHPGRVRAQMLGVRRASVNGFLQDFQRKGMIEYKLGQMLIKIRRKLEVMSCECYFVVKKEYQKLTGSLMQRSILFTCPYGWIVRKRKLCSIDEKSPYHSLTSPMPGTRH